jgi:bla regulator protein BlaR1
VNIILAILDAVMNSLWQALAVTALVWLALKFAPRINAATRHAIWWATLAVVLVLPAAPRLIRMMRPHPQPVTVKVVKTPEVTAAPVATEPVIVTVAPGRTARWPLAIFAVWAAILLWRMLQIGRSYFYLRGVKRRAVVSPMPLPSIARRVNLVISRDIVSPMAVGFLRPAVVLPESLLAELSEPERDHVLLHESAHLAKYDDWSNLAMRIMGGLLALHPVAIWILRRIEREREMACDDWVVARTGSARPYAASLARLVELRQAPRGEMLASGLLGSGSRIGDRIEFLLRCDRTFSPRASTTSVAASTIVLCGLMLAGSLVPRWIAFAQAQPRPAFDVVSIKPNVSGVREVTFAPMSGGRLTVENNPVTNLIQNAYGVRRNQIVGGPGWMDSDRFDIEARAEGSPAKDQLMLMVQTLLEDRFKLKVHRETRELPVFILTAAKSGVKLKPWQEGSCVTIDPFNPPTPPPRGEKPPKGCSNDHVFPKGPNTEWVATKIDMKELAGALAGAILRRPVIDKTGFTGTFDINLEWTTDQNPAAGPDGTGPASTDAAGPSIFTVLQEQLGLKLESAKGPVEVLVVDHLEKPDAN